MNLKFSGAAIAPAFSMPKYASSQLSGVHHQVHNDIALLNAPVDKGVGDAVSPFIELFPGKFLS